MTWSRGGREVARGDWRIMVEATKVGKVDRWVLHGWRCGYGYLMASAEYHLCESKGNAS